MKKTTTAFAAAAFALSAIAAAPATTLTEASQADDRFDHHVALELDGEVVSVDGGIPQGVNPNYFDIAPGTVPGGTCDGSPTNYCELVEVTIDTTGLHPVNAAGETQDLLIFGSFDLASTQPAADFDLDVYRLKADGSDGDHVGQSGRTPVADTDENGYDENVPFNLTITPAEEGEVKFVVKVVYFAAPSTYRLDMFGSFFGG